MTREKLPVNENYEEGAKAAALLQQEVLAHPEDFTPDVLQIAPLEALAALDRMKALAADGNIHAQEQADHLEGFLSRWD